MSFMFLPRCLFVFFLSNFIQAQSSQNNASKPTSAGLPGDFIVGVLVSVHHQPSPSQASQRRIGQHLCGEVREHYGIQRTEAVIQTIDEINADPTILPNITLGYQILDTCWYAPIALRQTIELIRGTEDEKCTSKNVTVAQKAIQKHASSATKANNATFKNTLIGIIGPGSSSIALQVQNLLQLFSLPQIGYSTTSRDLSDKARYNTFLRVVPSDYYQAQVMIDIVRRFNWTYVSAVNTDENYGQSGIQAFRELAEKYDVCIAREDSVLSNADKSQFDDVLRNLEYDKLANVVVCFCEGMTVRGLLASMERLNLSDRFLFIGTDGWADRADVVLGYERQALGSITVRIHSPYVESFDKRYFGLSPFTNTRNPWFTEFWEHKFGCQLPGDPNILQPLTNFFDKKVCTGKEDLSEKYKQEPKLSFVIKAIKTMAIALNQLQQDTCGTNFTGACSKMYPFNGTLFFNYLLNVSFPYGPDGDMVEFDHRGDPPGRYDIMNFQVRGDTYDYVKIADWNNGTLDFIREYQEPPPGPIESVCSKPCPNGYYKSIQTGGQEKKCCWVCLPCDRHQILANETYCQDCAMGYWPNKQKNTCLPIRIEHMQWDDGHAIISMTFSVTGTIATFITLCIFIRYNNTPVVKSSTRELCYIILIGMIFSHVSVFAILKIPTEMSCGVSRFVPGVSFSMIYASLFVKTNRIARILAGSKKSFPSKRLKFMSASAQLVLTSVLIFIEIIITVAMLIVEPPGIEHQYPTRRRVLLVCSTSARGVLVPLAFIFVLIGFCTLYAWKTRSVPENFNEAKFIGFAMYTTCVIWVAFLPIYFGSESKIITHCICISLSATVTLILLFFPKLYIILVRPERNIRAFFTTTSKIRCHIGAQKISTISSKVPSSFSSSHDCCECSKRSSIERNRVSVKSTAIQTSPDLKRLTLLADNAMPDVDKSSIISDLLYCGDPKSPSRNDIQNRPKQETPKIRFSEQNQYISDHSSLSVPQPGAATDRTMSSDSMDTLDNQAVNFNYDYYTTPYSVNTVRRKSTDSDERKYLCKDCARKDTYKWNPEHLRTTISEESLSGCSASESSAHEYKIKNITIKIGKPYYL
ncbi:metabotropic glutamate receptor 1-like [Culicoides brevitarsis]|uniref:metabotropic glutamate receptor 1-like n=1 Tax=Culicoides brevitarsis TaxID=469753 RepID=UPI00307C20D6